MKTSNKTVTNNNGIGFFGLLTVLFIGLKLTGYIAWSWLWVLAPLWMPLVVVLGSATVALIIVLLFAAIKGKK